MGFTQTFFPISSSHQPLTSHPPQNTKSRELQVKVWQHKRPSTPTRTRAPRAYQTNLVPFPNTSIGFHRSTAKFARKPRKSPFAAQSTSLRNPTNLTHPHAP